ncbi:MAG: hypothetical protein JEZ06_08045 [Anaerolineaceae bacterium]|nr:hypothetical protein [Anaerolineaceae bacterium]
MMANNIPPNESSYLEYLPTVFQEVVDGNGYSIGCFLQAFEKILSVGWNDDQNGSHYLGLEEILSNIHRYFNPGPGNTEENRAPNDFLPWLAEWVALDLRDDWKSEAKRRFIQRIVSLYRIRGTKAGLEEMLHTYTNMKVKVHETDTSGTPYSPHHFRVEVYFPTRTDDRYESRARMNRIARAIINQEKPAHTICIDLNIVVQTLQVGKFSTVGFDTMLGTPGKYLNGGDT